MSEQTLVALNRQALHARTGAPRKRAPVRIVHLGLGAFHRAHQAWYTSVASDAADWGIAAFTGRSAHAAEKLEEQDGLYSLVVRSAEADHVSMVGSISQAVAGDRVDLLIQAVAASETALVTLTVTEAGYGLDAGGRPNLAAPNVVGDIQWLRHNLNAARFDLDEGPRTPLARLLAGIEARRRTDAGDLAIVPCDNLPGNGGLTRRGLLALAEASSTPDLHEYLTNRVTFVSTSVDRITPKTTPADILAVGAASGWNDQLPVVTEPFHDWVLSGEFRSGRPDWEQAGARFVDDVAPFERRKLWLLNGAHTLLAYAGPARGHHTVAQAIGDPTICAWVEEFWDEAERHLPANGLDLHSYRRDLLARFENARIQHMLAQIGEDGVAKVRVRVAPVLKAERLAGREGAASARVLAAWIAAVRARRAPNDRAEESITLAAGLAGERGVAALLTVVDPELAADSQIITAVRSALADFTQR